MDQENFNCSTCRVRRQYIKETVYQDLSSNDKDSNGSNVWKEFNPLGIGNEKSNHKDKWGFVHIAQCEGFMTKGITGYYAT